MSAGIWIGVALLGGLGAIARFTFDGLASQWVGRSLPLGTLVINSTGAFLLGLLTGAALSANASVLLGRAALGSYTTFSTWMLETHRLGEDGRVAPGVGNALISVLIGVGAAALGRATGVRL